MSKESELTSEILKGWRSLGVKVPCDCGSDEASWHSRTRREYCCDKCYNLSSTKQSDWEWVEEQF